MSRLLLVGTSHRHAPVELRERLALDDLAATELAGRLAGSLGEAVVLSTCNRVCLYVASDDSEPAREQAVAELVALSGLPRAELESSLYVKEDREPHSTSSGWPPGSTPSFPARRRYSAR